MSKIRSVVDDCEIARILNAVAAGTGAVSPQSVNSAPVFVGDCEAFVIIALIGAIVSTGTVAFKLQHGDLADGTDLADVEGSALTQMGDADDNKMFVSEVFNPIKNYVNPVFTRATANGTVDGVIILKFGKRVRPVAQGATVKAAESLGSPASGTP